MKKSTPVTCLFVDIGGVLLTNGWDRHARMRAARHFGMNFREVEDRHHMAFEAYEQGRTTLDEYLSLVVFHERRSFTRADYRRFMFAQSQPYPEMLGLIPRLKERHGLKIVVVSNEGRELNAHRVRTFDLAAFVDVFISSSFVHVRKPDARIFTIALDVAQVTARQVVYLENTAMFAEVAEGLGIRSILHTDFESTRAKLAAFGVGAGEKGRTNARNRRHA
jgi:putative hydrolase of the HAD superfamily